MAYSVADTGATPLTFNNMLDQIAKLQREKSALDKEIKSLKVPAKAELKARGVKTYCTPEGTDASLYDTNRTQVDRKEAQRRVGDPKCGMTAEDLAAIFKVNTSENFKVK